MSDPEDQTEQVVEAGKTESFDFESAAQPKQVLVTDEELKKLQHEMMEYKDKYLRLLADQENSRKRLQKERLDQMRFANENLLIDFLRPIDNLENALNFAKEMSEEVKNWAIGFQMILNQFKDILNLNGVTPFEAKGTQFDPHLHEAVEMIESNEYPPGFVIEVCMRGYKIGDKVIRPARVKVTKMNGAEQNSSNEEKNEENP